MGFNKKTPARRFRRMRVVLDAETGGQGFTGSGFLAQTEHQPAAVTILPAKAAQGPEASPGLPV